MCDSTWQSLMYEICRNQAFGPAYFPSILLSIFWVPDIASFIAKKKARLRSSAAMPRGSRVR